MYGNGVMDSPNPNEGRAFTRFYLDKKPNPDKTREAGFTVYDEVEMIDITPLGSNGLHVWTGEVNDSHKRRFPKEYQAWKEGREAPLNGTPLATWPLITDAWLENCKGLKIFTIEDLAEFPDGSLKKLGMGASAWKQKAQDWLKAAKGGTGQLVEQISAINAKLEAISARNTELEEENRFLKANKKSGKKPAKDDDE